MFVRWKKRACKAIKRGTTYSAYLVQSKRVNGKPRQEVVAFLGNLSTYRLHTHLNQQERERFLRLAMKRVVDHLGYLHQAEAQRLAFAEALARKVDELIAYEERPYQSRSAVIGTTLTMNMLQQNASL
ncbi:MAG TPA: hypothetical protein VFV38_24250 [Ktedonobacteraceae bacterium]|nr:hypothetical protein [Ktedonobacteraceae bacterium]